MLEKLFRRRQGKTAEQLIAAGNRAEQEGRLNEACQLYRQAVQAEPGEARARLNLGIGLEAMGDLAGARSSFEEALRMQPANAAASYNLGRLLYTQGAHAEAVRHLSTALDTRADFPEARIVRGHARHAMGELDGARLDFIQGLQKLPLDEGATIALAAVRASLTLNEALEHHGSGRRMAAENGYRAVLRDAPDHAAALHFLGVLAHEDGRHDEAARLIERSLQRQPANGQAHFILGCIRQAQGRPDDAIACYRAAISCEPQLVDALYRLGTVLSDRALSEDALIYLRRALALERGRADTHFAIARSERDLGHLDEAIAAFGTGLALAPATADAHFALGDVLRAAGRRREALASLAKAIELDPEHVRARWSSAMTELPMVCGAEDDAQEARTRFAAALEDLDRWFDAARLDKGSMAVGSNQPFALAYQEQDNRALLERYGNLCTRLMAHWQRNAAIAPPPPRARPRPIRIGIVSAHLRHHSVWSAITKGWFAGLDGGRFALLAFHLGRTEDAETAFARAHAAHYEAGAKDLSGWASAIRAGELDVLIYPDIGMDPMTARLASLRLAPVQVASWGHPETTGMPTIDHYLSANGLEPEGAQAHYTERLVLLPNLGCSFDRMAFQPAATPGATADEPLLVCPGMPFKYAPQHDWVLAEIARRLGACWFLFFSHGKGELTGKLAERLKMAFRKRGLDFERHVVFLPWQAPAAFLGWLRRADVYLDTLGFSGFNTALFAVEAGLPIVTREGRFLRGRLASGILKRLEMDELVARDEMAYVELAVRLVQDAAYRENVAARVRARSGRLYNDPAPLRALEHFLERVCS